MERAEDAVAAWGRLCSPGAPGFSAVMHTLAQSRSWDSAASRTKPGLWPPCPIVGSLPLPVQLLFKKKKLLKIFLIESRAKLFYPQMSECITVFGG